MGHTTKPIHRRPKLFAAVSLGALLAVTTLLGSLRWHAVAGLQEQFSRSWEISYDYNGTPPLLPQGLKRLVQAKIFRRYGKAGYPKNYDSLLVDRFESLFVGPIETIDVWYPGDFTISDPASALARFPSLRSLWIMDNWPDRPPAQWDALATAIADQKLDRLAMIQIGYLAPTTIKTLSSSDTLREVIISGAKIPDDSAAVLESWNTLDRLVLKGCDVTPSRLRQLQTAHGASLEFTDTIWGFAPRP